MNGIFGLPFWDVNRSPPKYRKLDSVQLALNATGAQLPSLLNGALCCAWQCSNAWTLEKEIQFNLIFLRYYNIQQVHYGNEHCPSYYHTVWPPHASFGRCMSG